MDQTEESRDIEFDIKQMERMLEEFLAFAQADVVEEAIPTDPFMIADSVADSLKRFGRTIVRIDEKTPSAGEMVHLRATSIQRALQNLVSNAARHGEIVKLTVALTQKRVEFKVEDDGPGIPFEKLSEAIMPFVRLDDARSQNTEGNVGLGLAIAMDVARSHGGVLELDGSPDLGGLRATLSIPR